MKPTKLFLVLSLLAIIPLFTCCDDEDKINFDHLTGEWHVVYNNPEADESVTYKFNPDNTCIKHVFDFSTGKDTTIYRTYVISNDHKIITLNNEENIYTEQYEVTKLNSKEMEWVNTTRSDGNTDKKLTKKR